VGLAVPDHVVVEEGAVIVGVESLQGKGQGGDDLVQGLADRALAAAQHRSSLHPPGGDVGAVEGVSVLPVSGVATVSDEVGLRGPRAGDVPPLRLDGDLVFEQGAGLGAAVEAAPQPLAVGLEQAVDDAGADGAQPVLDSGRVSRRMTALRW